MTTIPKVLTVDGWAAHREQTGEYLHLFIDGEDVTRGAFRAEMDEDGIHGRVWRFLSKTPGHYYVDPKTDGVAQEVLYGVLEIKPGEPLR